MRTYYEAIEIIGDELGAYDYARIDVTSLNSNQRNNTIDDLKLLFDGKVYDLFIHYCYHDEDQVTPCRTESIP